MGTKFKYLLLLLIIDVNIAASRRILYLKFTCLPAVREPKYILFMDTALSELSFLRKKVTLSITGVFLTLTRPILPGNLQKADLVIPWE